MGVSYVLVDDGLDQHGLHDVRDELRVCVGISDLVVEESPHTALETQTHAQLVDWSS